MDPKVTYMCFHLVIVCGLFLGGCHFIFFLVWNVCDYVRFLFVCLFLRKTLKLIAYGGQKDLKGLDRGEEYNQNIFTI